jgi:AraC-like DNA-binding protein
MMELGVVLYPCALYIFRMGIYIFAMWYLLFPLVILIYYLSMNALRWLFYAILTIGSLFVMEHIFIFHNIENVKQEWKDDISIITLILMGIVLAYFIFIFGKKMMIFKDEKNLPAEKKNIEKNMDDDKNKAKVEQYRKVWEQIIAHFEANEPFISHNYTISILATEINTNASYISRAIAANSEHNFSSLVNHFRIEKAKKMLVQGDLKRFSMEHIYTSSGFKYQSTFNEAFKKQERITPSEFATK